ncbi:MAG: hypothetical protein AAF430_21300 [Myxococcota bacterium]
MGTIRVVEHRPQQRRSFRWRAPGAPSKLALGVLGLTLGFGALAVGNSMAAYRDLFGATLALAPEGLAHEIVGQTRLYLNVTAAICSGWAIAVAALCAAYVHRLMGPTVALERHVRALSAGDYSARVSLRRGAHAYTDLARGLNALAERLERTQR